MHLTQTFLGQVAGFIAVCSLVPYLVSIIKGRTKPSRAGYAIWSIVEVVWITSYISAGATTTKWTGIVFAASAVTIFGLSLKYGMGGLNFFDIPCLILAVIAVYIWVTSHDPVLAVYMSTLADVLGFLPIIKKSYLWPQTENTLSWVLYAVAAAFNVLALNTLTPVISIGPLSSLALAVVIAGLLIFPRRKKRLLRLAFHKAPS